jgi:hypothetical protein
MGSESVKQYRISSGHVRQKKRDPRIEAVSLQTSKSSDTRTKILSIHTKVCLLRDHRVCGTPHHARIHEWRQGDMADTGGVCRKARGINTLRWSQELLAQTKVNHTDIYRFRMCNYIGRAMLANKRWVWGPMG